MSDPAGTIETKDPRECVNTPGAWPTCRNRIDVTKTIRLCADCGSDISDRHWRSRRCAPCQAARETQALAGKTRTMYDHECAWCGNAFRNRVKTAKYCSRKCSGDSSHPGNVQRTCVVCDTEFVVSRQFDKDTCSRPCAKWAREHPGQKPSGECLRCGVALDGHQLRKRFCSITCSVAVRYLAQGKTKTMYRRADGCLICGASLEGRTHRTQYCSHACQALIGHERRSRKMSSAPVERVLPAEIFARDDWTCHICDGVIDRTLRGKHPNMASLDHVIPVDDPNYPGHVWENLATAHLRCNISKGHKATQHDWDLYRELASRRP